MGAALYLFQERCKLFFLQRVLFFFDDARERSGTLRIDAEIAILYRLLQSLMKNTVNILYRLCRKGIDCRVGRRNKLIVKVLYCVGV